MKCLMTSSAFSLLVHSSSMVPRSGMAVSFADLQPLQRRSPNLLRVPTGVRCTFEWRGRSHSQGAAAVRHMQQGLLQNNKPGNRHGSHVWWGRPWHPSRVRCCFARGDHNTPGRRRDYHSSGRSSHTRAAVMQRWLSPKDCTGGKIRQGFLEAQLKS